MRLLGTRDQMHRRGILWLCVRSNCSASWSRNACYSNVCRRCLNGLPHLPAPVTAWGYLAHGATGNLRETSNYWGKTRMEQPRPPAGGSQRAPWQLEAPTWGLPSSSAFSDDAALAQRLAELDEVILPAPAHPPDPGPDVAPARTYISFCHR